MKYNGIFLLEYMLLVILISIKINKIEQAHLTLLK